MSAPLRVLVVDDHPLFREGLAAVVGSLHGVEVAGEAADGEEAVVRAAALEPDLVVMDLHMPGVNGIEATRRILAARPATAILVLTMLENDDSVVSALRAGARGYLVKGSTKREIARAVEAVAGGGVVLGPSVGPKVLAAFAGAASRGNRVTAFPELTEREHQVLDLVARGLTNGQVAQRLYVSEKTVRNTVSSVFSKLGVGSRAEAVARARDAGLGQG